MTQIVDQVCLIDGCHGIYVPREFVLGHNMSDWGVSNENMMIILAGPDGEYYWEAWDEILNDAKIIIDGEEWRLAQDGDLFAVRMR